MLSIKGDNNNCDMMKNLILVFGFLFASSAIVTAQAECAAIEPPNGLNKLAAFSIFQSNFKNKDYPLALEYGRWILCTKPETIEGFPGFELSRQLDRFTTIYQEFAKEQTDPSIKATYLDSALMVFDIKLELYADDQEQVYKTHQQKGRFYLENNSIVADAVTKAYEEFQLMFDLDSEKTTTTARGYYVENLIRNYINKKETAKAQEIINEASKYATGGLVEKLNEFQKDLFETPEDVIAYYQPILEQEPKNVEALKALEGAYEDQDNQTELTSVRRKLHEIQPTYESAKALAETEKSNARYAEAIKLYKEALKMAKTKTEKKQTNLNIADGYINQGDIKTADKFVDAAIKIDPNYGRAYIAKATIYNTAITNCIADRKLEAKDRMVYWLVIDYLNMAKSKDPSVANTVNSQLGSYQAVTPTGEDKFLRLGNLKDGQKVKIDGSVAPCYAWINKTTTVR
jgi:tetratricopeptide (TPR) repeat protein|tara:strand:- start:2899 stop:4275 length:1377 start_codon:yes stop_codon:yes gene_type:complete